MAATTSADCALEREAALGIRERPDGAELVLGLVRHPLRVSLVVGLAAIVAIESYVAIGDRLIAGFIAVVLVIVAATDLERRIIPNQVILPAVLLVLLARAMTRPAHAAEFVVAALAATLLFLIPNLVSRSAIGMGDVKLAAFLGAGLGWSAFGAIAAAFFAVFPFALAALIRGGLSARKSTLPFGPFLAFGGLVILIVPRLVG